MGTGGTREAQPAGAPPPVDEELATAPPLPLDEALPTAPPLPIAAEEVLAAVVTALLLWLLVWLVEPHAAIADVTTRRPAVGRMRIGRWYDGPLRRW